MRSIREGAEDVNVLEIEALQVWYPSREGREAPAVRDFSLRVGSGECVGIVGESGAGKSQAMLAALGLLGRDARVSGSVRFRGEELIGAQAARLNRIRGAALTMIFQDPLTSLTPHMRVGEQIAESLVVHERLSSADARARALELLSQVQIADAERRARQYPHELSGGMRQRVMIAMALACSPALIVADEPTTALDVTIQAQIIRLLGGLKRERSMSVVLVTHDLGVVAGIADRVVVMQAGSIVEQGGVREILTAPRHPHTQALLAAAPRIEVAASRVEEEQREMPGRLTSARSDSQVLVEAVGLCVEYRTRVGGWRSTKVQAVRDAELHVAAGESIGIVGESGCGKSTLARALLRLLEPSQGCVVWLGRDVSHMKASSLRPLRREVQIVFQDPLASLDPRMTVEQLIAEPLRIHRPSLGDAALREAVGTVLSQVALPSTMLNRFPHELSGGQAQRVGIARAMVLKPRALVCDEAVSALDLTTQAQIVDLVNSLRREHGLALLFISHNLGVVRRVCDRVLVLYLGRMMEQGPVADLYSTPAHPYTRALLESIPIPDPDRQPGRLSRALAGEPPSPLAPPPGCVFSSRCPHAIEACRREAPAWETIGEGRQVACIRWREWPQGAP